MTRVHAADGSLLAEYAHERRLYLPIQAIPKLVTNAFVAAEDKNFYEHTGLDFQGITRAGLVLRRELRQRPPSAGRLHHHPAGRQELPAHQRSYARAARSRRRCWRCASSGTYSKQKILELYLNEIYLGLRRLRRRGRLAALFRQVGARTDHAGGRLSRGPAQGPEQLQSVPPSRRGDRAPQLRHRPHGRGRLHHARRGRAGEEGAAQRSPRGRPARASSPPNISPRRCAATLADNYGEKKLYEGGLSVRTTLDPKLQVLARKALVDGLVQLRREASAIAAPSPRSTSAATGAVKLAEVQALDRRRALAAGGGAGRQAIRRRASACSRAAIRAARCSRSARPAPSRSTA